MYLIVGLGNPGTEYAATRHNIGFDMITYLSDKYRIPMRGKEGKAIVGKGFIEGQKVMLAQPQTFM
ncbi:MAG: aminoacyl-tRNA hydrolase, partial [Eubacterium sp.]|nr:aminoacyl-tRNA hydrolase [Eubacterium sp.]